MPLQTRAQIDATIAADFADNTTGDISAQDLRDGLTDLADSALFLGDAEVRVISMALDTPPGSPADRDAYVVAATATGDWTGEEDRIAVWDASLSPAAWVFYAPEDGSAVWNLADDQQYRWDADASPAAWVAVSGGGGDVTSVNGQTGAVIVAPLDPEINAQTGTSYTLVLTDRGKHVTMNNGSANTLTIPTNASVAFPTGTIVAVSQLGAGTTTVEGDTGVTVNGVSAGSADLNAQYDGVTLTKLGTDTWLLQGAHGGVS